MYSQNVSKDEKRPQMKNLSIMLLVVMVSMASYAKMQEKEIVKESVTPSFQPKPLDDEWSKWLVGKREVTGASHIFLVTSWKAWANQMSKGQPDLQ